MLSCVKLHKFCWGYQLSVHADRSKHVNIMGTMSEREFNFFLIIYYFNHTTISCTICQEEELWQARDVIPIIFILCACEYYYSSFYLLPIFDLIVKCFLFSNQVL